MMLHITRMFFLLGVAMALGACAAMGPSELDPEDDQSVARAVHSEIRTAPVRGVNRVAVEVDEGVVTVSGPVPDPVTAGEVVVRAEQVPGVVRVVSDLDVQASGEDEEEEGMPGQQQQTQPPPGG